jgi:hypothetical protein
MVYFQTKNSNFDFFGRPCNGWKVLEYIMAIWYISWIFGIFCDYFEYLNILWSFFGIFFPVLVCCDKKSGNPDLTVQIFRQIESTRDSWRDTWKANNFSNCGHLRGYLYLVDARCQCIPNILSPGVDVIIFLNFAEKFTGKNWRFWLKTKLNYAKF